MSSPINFGKGRGRFMRQPKVRVKNMSGIISRLWSYLAEVRVPFIFALLFLICSTALQVVAPYFQGIAIDEGILQSDLNKLISTLLLMAALYILMALMVLLQNRIMIVVSQKVIRSLRNHIFGKLQTLSLPYFDRNPHGELMSRVSNDIDLISQTLTSSLTQLISSFLSVISVGILMISLNYRLAAIALISIPLIILITKYISRYTRKGYKNQQEYLGNLNGQIEESVSALKTV